MASSPLNLDTAQDAKTAEHCPVCGAGDFSATLGNNAADRQPCRHCGFEMCLSPHAGKADFLQQSVSTDDLKHHAGANHPVWLNNIIEPKETVPPTGPVGKLVIAGHLLEISPDVNQLMRLVADMLDPRGLVVIDVMRKPTAHAHFFGCNSLQILLECHGFRLSARPWKWRLQWPGKTRRYLARKLH